MAYKNTTGYLPNQTFFLGFYKFIIFIYIWRTPKNHYTKYLYFEELSYYTNKSPCFKITISDKFHVKITLLQYNQPVYPTPDIDINFSNNLNSYNLPTQYFITQIYWISKIHFFPPHKKGCNFIKIDLCTQRLIMYKSNIVGNSVYFFWLLGPI